MYTNELRPIADLNYRLLQAIDIGPNFWNALARSWFEQYGSLLAHEIYDFPGSKLWIQASPFESVSKLCKVGALLADHVIVGHCGPLPPIHLGLAHPEITYSSSQPAPQRYAHREPYIGFLEIDGIRRPLPPVAWECIMGDLRIPLLEGSVSYFPASVIYAPFPGNPWPSPSSIFDEPSSEISFVSGSFTVYEEEDKKFGKEVRIEARSQKHLEILQKANAEKRTIPSLNKIVANRINSKYMCDEEISENDISWGFDESGLLKFSDYRASGQFWEWSQEAINWEQILAGLIASGGISSPKSLVKISNLPEAIFDIEIPSLANCPWEAIFEIKDEEKNSLFNFRQAILKACDLVKLERGTKFFKNAVEEIQRNVINNEVSELEKTFKDLKKRHAGKVFSAGIGAITLELACYFGLPQAAALLAGGKIIQEGINLSLDIKKERSEWYKNAQESPMYFIWRLSHHKSKRKYK